MTLTNSRLSMLVLGALLLPVPSMADTVLLKNGSRISGTIESDERDRRGSIILRINQSGHIILRYSEITSIEKGDGNTAPASNGGFVEVELKKGNAFYGSGSYFGRISSASTDKELVLDVPSAGTIRIPRSAVKSIAQVPDSDSSLVPIAARNDGGAPRRQIIETTHAVYLRNGRKLTGALMSTAQSEPLKLRVGDLGVMILNRADVLYVEEEAGVIEIGGNSTAGEATSNAETDDTEAGNVSDLDTLKAQLKEEILRELLEQMVESKLDATLQAERVGRRATLSPLSSNELLQVQDSVRELGRNRTRNRVRAERKLKSYGKTALSYLRPAVHHPFNLTRRAAQRVVRDIGSPEGALLAMDGLVDPDREVRQLAIESLRKILPEVVIAYHWDDSVNKLNRAQAEYWAAWDELRLEEAKQATLDRIYSARR